LDTNLFLLRFKWRPIYFLEKSVKLDKSFVVSVAVVVIAVSLLLLPLVAVVVVVVVRCWC
jgi:hypothetical protein